VLYHAIVALAHDHDDDFPPYFDYCLGFYTPMYPIFRPHDKNILRTQIAGGKAVRMMDDKYDALSSMFEPLK